MIPESDEFFVGYLPEGPAKTMSFLRWVTVLLGLGITTVGILLAINQREFSLSNFEYGKYTTLEGYVFKLPIPHLKIAMGFDSLGSVNYKTLLLVGSGKMGADKSLSAFEDTLGKLEGELLKLEGELIYGDGKSLLQISSDRLPTIEASAGSISSTMKSLGVVSVQGEIVDPKCYFGVMKPGEGKPHRSCAIRCIAGGIPPVFHVTGTSDYYILLDENSQPVNTQVLDLVSDPITLTGETFSFDNWKILQVRSESLDVLAAKAKATRNRIVMEEGMTLCQLN